MTHFRKENRDFLSGLGLQGHGFDPWSRELTSHVPPGSSAHGTSPGKNTGEGCHSLLQAIFPTQGSSLGLLGRFFTLTCICVLVAQLCLTL